MEDFSGYHRWEDGKGGRGVVDKGCLLQEFGNGWGLLRSSTTSSWIRNCSKGFLNFRLNRSSERHRNTKPSTVTLIIFDWNESIHRTRTQWFESNLPMLRYQVHQLRFSTSNMPLPWCSFVVMAFIRGFTRKISRFIQTLLHGSQSRNDTNWTCSPMDIR